MLKPRGFLNGMSIKRASVLMAALLAVLALVFAGCSSGSSQASGNSSASAKAAAPAKPTSASDVYSGLPKFEFRENTSTCFVGKAILFEGSEKDFPHKRLWAAVEFDRPAVFSSRNLGDYTIERIQVGQVASDGGNQAAWEPYEGKRVAVKGSVKGATWNFWHLTPCYLEDAVVVDSGEGHWTDRRNEIAVEFAKEMSTNYRIENGESVHVQRDIKKYISPTSELYEWQDGNDEGEDVLILGNPCRVESAEIAEVIGNTYIVAQRICHPSPDGLGRGESCNTDLLAVTFNDDDLIQHVYRVF